jgi:hypothetical protein
MVLLEYNDMSNFFSPAVIYLNIKYFRLQDMMEMSALSIWIQSLAGKNLRSGKIMYRSNLLGLVEHACNGNGVY